MPETLFEKVWNRHVVKATDEATLLYIDRHLIHEVTSPQAFDGLRLAGRKVRRPDLTVATVDHNVPTENQLDIREPMSRRQVETLRANCREFGVDAVRRPRRPSGDRPCDRPRAGPDPARAPRSSAATATPAPTGRSGPWRSGSARARSSTSWPRKRCGKGKRPTSFGIEVTGKLAPGLEPKDIILAIIRADRHRRGDRDTSSSITARRSRPSRWKAG